MVTKWIHQKLFFQLIERIFETTINNYHFRTYLLKASLDNSLKFNACSQVTT